MDLPTPIIESTITRGTILFSTIFEEIDHGKFFVIIGISDEYVAGFFFINSHIHPAVFNKEDQLNMQYVMRKADYSFLQYDSYLCATNVITRTRKELAESMKRNQTSIIDTMRKEHIDEVLDMVRNSRLFSNIEKRRYFY